MDANTNKQEYWAPMEEDLKQLLGHLHTQQRDNFAIIYRIIYQWRIETITIKGNIQLLQRNLSNTEDIQDIVRELQSRVERLDASLTNCLSIANALPVE